MFHVKHSGSCCASTRQTGSRNSLISLSFSRSSASACRKRSSKNSKSSARVSSELSPHSPRPRIGAEIRQFLPYLPEESIRTSPTLLDARTRAAGSRRRDRRAIFRVERHGIFLQTQIGTAFQQPHATVPAEDGVVVALWAQLLRFREAAQRLLQKRSQRVRETPGTELRFDAAFVEQAGVIKALVGVAQGGKNGIGFRIAVRGGAGELVGDGEPQHPAGELMVRVRAENVAADGFGFFGLVQIAVEFGLGNRFGDAGFGNGFQLDFHRTPFTAVEITADISWIRPALKESSTAGSRPRPFPAGHYRSSKS